MYKSMSRLSGKKQQLRLGLCLVSSMLFVETCLVEDKVGEIFDGLEVPVFEEAVDRLSW